MIMYSILLTALAAAASPQNLEVIDREYDVSALSVLGTLEELRFRASQAFFFSEGPQTPSPFGGEELLFRERSDFVQLLYDLFEEEFSNEYTEMYLLDDSDAQGRMLRLVAPAETHTDFALALETLASALNSGAQLTLDVIPNAPEGSLELLERGTASAEELGALRASAGVETYSCFVPRHTYGMQRSAATRELVAGYTVEIAQGAFIHDPVRMVVSEGLEMAAAARPVEGGHWVGLGLQRLFDLSAPATRELALPGRLGTLEQGVSELDTPVRVDEAEVSCHAFAFDAFVPAGQALIFGAKESGLGGIDGTTVYALQVTSVGSTEPMVTLESRSQRLNLIDGGAATLPGWKGGLGFNPFGGGRVEDWWEEEDLYRSGISYDTLEGTDADSLETWLFVYGDPERDADAANQMGRIQALLNERTRRSSPSRRATFSADLGNRASVSCWLPMSPGWLGTAIVGRFGLQQVLEDVEVATTAATADLLTRRTGVGLAVSSRTSEVGSLDSTSVTAFARLGASSEIRGLLRSSTAESELLSGAETNFRGTDLRERGAEAPPIAGAVGGAGPVIRMRLRP